MAENMGVKKLAERFDDEEMEQFFEGIFPFVATFFSTLFSGFF